MTGQTTEHTTGHTTGHTSALDLLAPEHRGLFIGGTWRDAEGGARFDVLDPADGSVITDVADGSTADAMQALDAAAAAQADWAGTPPRDRGEILRRAFEMITDRADDFAGLMSLEMGKTVKEAKGEVTYGAEFFRWYSEEAVRIHGRWMQAPAGGSRLLTIKKPVGPCLFVTPWNFPLAMGTRKIGPAVAAGCTMVVKPAAQTPLTMLALAALLAEAGLPDGVLNVVTTRHAGDVSKALQADDRLRKVSFTGSTGIGRVLIRQSADQLQRVSMELGGNAPFLVFEDADVDAAVDGAMIAKMRNMGEACTAANRFLVHSSVAPEFADKLSKRMGSLTLGRGQDEGVDVGPLIDEKAVESVSRLVTDAVQDGATVVTGGEAPDGPGYFYPPTVLLDVPADAAINTEEIFGPVAPITTFETEQEAITRANATEYGLSSYVYTRDLERTLRLAEALEFGMVGVNTGLVSNPAAPFGGVKASGFGREGGFEGIEEYLETTYVALPMST
ncbi:MAG TPA: NAD-dependent succinate-semialdehyde dehydrogenase [Geminicoccaceae bacterium]|nr:NAD-dependent succinate-semialdehyde dehydrogenase [Geminicoccaceae bacterium]